MTMENTNTGKKNSGNQNSGDQNSGNQNSGDQNSGNRNSGNRNSGNRNSGDQNSGNQNSGNRNSGDQNSGNRNSGDQNSGNRNSGDRNSGNQNSGNRNSGDQNSGYWNSGNRNSGIFCVEGNPKIKLFDSESDWRIDDWFNCKANTLLQRFLLTEWVDFNKMSEQEKIDFPKAFVCDGYLKNHDYKVAFKTMWDSFTAQEKQIILDLPNFNSEKFYEITGVDVKTPIIESLIGKVVTVNIDGKEFKARIL